MIDLARILVPVNYARGERFDHDPAVSLPIVPKLDRAPQLASLTGDRTLYRSLQTELIRERNKIVDQLDAARLIAERLSIG
jgi:N-acetylated-alpha-linked acidic dipeptidase